jgi:sec-independent protein translocase protein TatA
MGHLGTTEILLILLVVVLLFGAKKLPELARGSGRALRIFKSETKGLMDEGDKPATDPHGRPMSELNSGAHAATESTSTSTSPADETSTTEPRV